MCLVSKPRLYMHRRVHALLPCEVAVNSSIYSVSIDGCRLVPKSDPFREGMKHVYAPDPESDCTL